MKFRFWEMIAIIMMVVSLTGCGSGVPAGFPDSLESGSIKVVKGGVPEQNVFVNCVGRGAWVVSGTTDSSGVAVLSTTLSKYQKTGIPTGEFTVTLSKIVEVPHTKTPEEQGKMTGEESEVYMKEYLKKVDAAKAVVPLKLGKPTSPIKLKVESGKPANLTVELNDYQGHK